MGYKRELKPALKPEDIVALTHARGTLERAAVSPAAFREVLIIPAARGAVKLSDVQAEFQERDFNSLDPAFMALRSGTRPDVRRFWLERTKGASKDTDLAVMLLWLLSYTKRPLVAQVAATDALQADELRKAALAIVRLNPWLGRIIDVQATAIVNRHTDSRCDILTADAMGSHGARPDLLIINELTHQRNEEFPLTLMDNADKVDAVVIIATNAGFRPSWQWTWRTTAIESGHWCFSHVPTVAPWISREAVAEAQKRNPPSRFARLWGGQWVGGGGDAIAESDLDAALTESGPMTGSEAGWVFSAGLDIGLKRDATALVVVASHVGWFEKMPAAQTPSLPTTIDALVDLGLLDGPTQSEEPGITHEPTGRTRLASVQVWRPTGGQKIDLSAVEEACVQANARYGLSSLCADPWQAEMLLQRLASRGVPAEGVPFVPAVLQTMATIVLEAFTERAIDLYDDPELLADLRGLRAVERQYGVRLESPRGPAGHGDSATGLALAMYGARRAGGGRVRGELVCYPE
jgi:hypothetical protein